MHWKLISGHYRYRQAWQRLAYLKKNQILIEDRYFEINAGFTNFDIKKFSERYEN
jgi:hypothetical protein